MKRLLFPAFLIALIASRARAEFATPQEAPVDRLIANISAYIKENPNDPQGPYILGRVHYLAFANKSAALANFFVQDAAQKKLPVPAPYPGRVGENKPPTDDQLKDHALQAAANFELAIKLAPDNPLYHLGRASLFDTVSRSALEIKLPGTKEADKPADLKAAWREEAIAGYLKALDLAAAKDLKLTSQPLAGLQSLVSWEAATKYIKLVKEREPKEGEKDKIVRAEKVLADLQKIPQREITPIIFSLRGEDRLEQLLDPHKTVKFDLDGTGRGRQWPWVKADTAILVWDPKHTDKIDSGRQLFGSVTFWMFWSDGYAALNALDDNRDGELSGSELAGLAVWRDANQNGISDAGEVMPIESIGVASISVRWNQKDGKSPGNRLGLRMKDGRMLATWDWVVW